MTSIDTELVLVALGAMLALLERHARTIAAAILLLLAAVLMRNGIAGLTA